MSALRFDSVELRLDKAEPTPEGWLRVPASIGSVGVFPYRRADGSIRYELRPPDEVFHADSLRSFSALPVTNNHPGVRLDSKNVEQHQVGQTATATASGSHVLNDVLLTKEDAISAARGGKRQLSPGYTVELDETPGTWRGQRYDAVQRRIRGNHVALVELGRQGPTVSLRMDSGDAVAITDTEEPIMKKIKLDDGTEVEVSEAVYDLITKLRADAKPIAAISNLVDVKLDTGATIKLSKEDAGALKGALAKAKPEPKADGGDDVAALKARIDALESSAKTAKEEARADAIAFADALAHARVIVDSDYRADGKSLEDVMRDVVLKVDESAKARLDEHKDAPGYLRARYEMALEAHRERKDHGLKLLEAARSGGTPPERQDAAAKAKAKAEAERSNAWKPTKAS